MSFVSSLFAVPRRNTARYAGLLYLLMAITAAFSLLTLPSKVIVKGNPAQTLQNLLTHEALVRWVMVSHFACHSIFLLLAMTLHRLFKGVHEHSAWLMVLFVTVQVPLVFIGEVFSYSALMIAKGDLMQSLEAVDKADFVMLLLKIRSYCFLSAQVFWGLWLIPLGRLTFSSGFMPRILGVMLVSGGVAYLIQTAACLLEPEQSSTIISVVYPVHTIAEISMILWLLIVGTTDKANVSSS